MEGLNRSGLMSPGKKRRNNPAMFSSNTGDYVSLPTHEAGEELSLPLRPLQKPTCLQAYVHSWGFQIFAGMIIFSNAVVIGLETDRPEETVWPKAQDVILVAFVLEVSLRIWADGVYHFFDSSQSDFNWNVFDFTVISFGFLDRIAIIALGVEREEGQARFVALLMRTFRLLRMLGIFRIFRVLKQFYILTTGIVDAVFSVFWVGIVGALVLYMCAIMLTRLYGHVDSEDPLAPFLTECFGSVGKSMLTLFQLMAYPDMEKFQPVYSESPGMQAFLIIFIIFGAFAMVSILTGAITESMFEKARQRQDERRFERDRARTFFVRSVRSILQASDGSGRGLLDRQTFQRCAEEILALCEDQYMDIRAGDLDAMFELVDYNSSGTIEIEELLYGMVQLSAEVRPMSIMELRRIIVRGLHGTNQSIGGLESRLKSMDRRLSEVLAATKANALAKDLAPELAALLQQATPAAAAAPAAPPAPAPLAAPPAERPAQPLESKPNPGSDASELDGSRSPPASFKPLLEAEKASRPSSMAEFVGTAAAAAPLLEEIGSAAPVAVPGSAAQEPLLPAPPQPGASLAPREALGGATATAAASPG